jgi:hypothetical protein
MSALERAASDDHCAVSISFFTITEQGDPRRPQNARSDAAVGDLAVGC